MNIEIALIIITVCVLNMTGAILTKFLALYFNYLSIAIGILSGLMLVHLLRLIAWLNIGRKYQLSFIYPALSINYLFSFFLGIVVFGESFKISKLIGSMIIITGVMILSFSQNKYEVH
jgi:drug/metabolite transporter (DMT)-like permease